MELVTLTLQDASPNAGTFPNGVTAALVADNSDATYWRFGSTGAYGNASTVDPVIPADALVWGVRLSARVRSNTAGNVFQGQMSSSGSTSWGSSVYPDVKTPSVVGNWENFVGPWRYTPPGGGTWNSAGLNNVSAFFQLPTYVSPGVDVSKVEMVMGLVYQPTAIISNPSGGSVGASINPIISWAYNGRGEPQSRYRVRVYSQTEGDTAGFTGTGGTPLYDSGWVSGSSSQHQLPAGLLSPGTVYHASVMVSKTMNFGGATGLLDAYDSPVALSRFTTNSIPIVTSVTVNGLASGNTVTTNEPIVTWVSQDPNSDPQDAFQIRVFTPAQVANAAFNADLDVPLWDSGVIESSVTQWKITPALANAQYQVLVKVRQALDKMWSNWGSISFPSAPRNLVTIAAVTPPAPTFKATPEPMGARVTLEVSPPSNAYDVTDVNSESNTLRVDRSDDGGVTWKNLRAVGISRAWNMVKGGDARTGHGWSLGTAWTGGTVFQNVRAVTTVNSTDTASSPTFPVVLGKKYVLRWNGSVTNQSGSQIRISYLDRLGTVQTFHTAWAPSGTVAMASYLYEFTPFLDYALTARIDLIAGWAPSGNISMIVDDVFVSEMPVVITDHECPLNIPVRYRAIAVDERVDTSGTNLTGLTVASAPTVVGPLTLVGKKVWLKNPLALTQGLTIPVQDGWLSRARNKTRTVHRPINRTLPVVVRGASEGEAFSMSFVVLGKAKFDAFMAILDANATLLLQTPKTQWYVEVTGLTVTEALWDDLHGDTPAWQISASLQEVASP